MSVTAFGAIPHDDPAAVGTLRFLQKHLHGGLHLHLGYSRGVWPYMSAEVALWHLGLGECDEAWRILEAIADRASTTVCWYEEIESDPPRGYGDPADVWAAAEFVHLASALLLSWSGDELRICPGLPDRHRQAGRTIGAEAAPTPWGPCTFELRFGGDGVSARIRFASESLPSRLRIGLAPAGGGRWKTIEVDGAAESTWEGRDLILAAPAREVRIEAR